VSRSWKRAAVKSHRYDEVKRLEMAFGRSDPISGRLRGMQKVLKVTTQQEFLFGNGLSCLHLNLNLLCLCRNEGGKRAANRRGARRLFLLMSEHILMCCRCEFIMLGIVYM
jgi:hypothetical protein